MKTPLLLSAAVLALTLSMGCAAQTDDTTPDEAEVGQSTDALILPSCGAFATETPKNGRVLAEVRQNGALFQVATTLVGPATQWVPQLERVFFVRHRLTSNARGCFGEMQLVDVRGGRGGQVVESASLLPRGGLVAVAYDVNQEGNHENRLLRINVTSGALLELAAPSSVLSSTGGPGCYPTCAAGADRLDSCRMPFAGLSFGDTEKDLRMTGRARLVRGDQKNTCVEVTGGVPAMADYVGFFTSTPLVPKNVSRLISF